MQKNIDPHTIRVNDWVAVTTPDGRHAVGPVTQVLGERLAKPWEYTIAGQVFTFRDHVYTSVAEGTPAVPADTVSTTKERLYEIFVELANTKALGRLYAASGMSQVAQALLGYNPTHGLVSRRPAGHLSADRVLAQHIDVKGIRKHLNQLVAEGKLVHVTQNPRGIPTEDQMVVAFHSQKKDAWIITEAYNAALADANKARETQLTFDLNRRAREIVADRHAAEVLAVVEELRAQK